MVELDITSPEQVQWFVQKFGDELKIRKRFNTCNPVVKIRYAGFINDDALLFEFDTDEDKRLYRKAGENGQDIEFVVVND